MRRWSTGDRHRAPRRLAGQPAPAWAASHYLDARTSEQRHVSALPAPRLPLDEDGEGQKLNQELGGDACHGTDTSERGSDQEADHQTGYDALRSELLEAIPGGRHRAGRAAQSVESLLARDQRDTSPSWATVLGSPEGAGSAGTIGPQRPRQTRMLGRYRPLDDDEPLAPRPLRPVPARLYPPLEVVPPLARTSRRERLTSGVLLVMMLLAGTVIGYHVLAPSNVVAALPPADTSPYGATGALPGSLSTPLPDAGVGQAPQEAGLPPVAGLSGIPATVLAAYHSAEGQLAAAAPGCRLSWSLLAGIGKIESDHARGGQVDTTGTTLHPILGPVLDGTGGNAAIADTDGGRLDGDIVHDRAVGPMQFLPGTWATWGVDASGDGRADPNNTADAATAAGRYLCAGGLDTSTTAGAHDAVFRYNHSESYVAHVLAWARAYATGTIPTPDNPAGDDPDSSSAAGPAPAGPDVLAAAATTPSPAPVLAAAAAAPRAAAPVALPPGATLLPILPAPAATLAPVGTSAPTATEAATPPASSSARTATPAPSSSSTGTTTPTTSSSNVTTTTTTSARATTSSPPAPTTTTTTAVPPTTSGVPVLGAPSPIAVTVPSSTPTSTTTTPSSSSMTRTPRPHPAHTSATRTTTPPSSSTSAGDSGAGASSSEAAGADSQGGTPVSSGVGGGGSTLDTAVSGVKALLGDVQTEGTPQPTLVSTGSGPGLRFALPGGGRRSEVIPPLAEYREGQQMWLHYRAQLTGVPVDTDTWQLIAQFHHDGNTGSPPIALEVGHGHLRLANQGAYQQDLGPVAADGIVDVVLHVAFSRDPARGQVDVWRDGTPVLAGYHPPGATLLDGGNYLKLGLYRDPAIAQASSVTVLEVQAQPTPLPTGPSS